MKPDGVATAALEPMEMLESSPANEAAPLAEPEPNQHNQETTLTEEAGQGEPALKQATGTPPAKTTSKASGDSKTKTANKATAKTKPTTTTTGSPKPPSTPRSNTTQSRVANGKPQTNGVARKMANVGEKKSTPTTAPPKKTLGTPGTPTSKSVTKVGEKKATGMSPASNGAKAAPTAAKKTPTTASNGLKSSPSAATAKKNPVSKSASTTSTKPSTVSSSKPDKPPVAKTTRPSSSSTRTAAGSSPSVGLAKSSSATSKPSTPKTSTTAKSATPKSTSTTPSTGRPPASQASKTTTPVKKDVSKPIASTSKKPTDSPLARSSPATKSAAKPDTPKLTSKSDVASKKPVANKTPDTKTPTRTKTVETKPPASKTPNAKASSIKNSSPKKTVGSSTPTPVKRGPKPAAAAEPANVAAAVGIATTAAAIVGTADSTEVSMEQSGVHETPEPVTAALLEPDQSAMPELVRQPTPEPVQQPSSEPVHQLSHEPVREQMPTPVREPTPEPAWKQTSEPVWEPTSEPEQEPIPKMQAELYHPSTGEDELVCEPVVQVSAQMDDFGFQESKQSVQSLGTTVMSPPCSPPGPASPVREPQHSALLDMDVRSTAWSENEVPITQSSVNTMGFHSEEEKENNRGYEPQEMHEEEDEEDKENLLMPTSAVPEAFSAPAQPHLLGVSPVGRLPSGELMSPQEKEEAVEKADQEINEDIDDDSEDDEEEQRRAGQQLSSMMTDISTSQPSDEFQVRSSVFGGSAGWHGDDLLSGMDSEDVSSCTSGRQPGVSDLSSTQHTAILEGTQSSDALVDSSLRGSEGDCNLMGSPNVETLANEEEEDEDEEDERVDDIDMNSEKLEEQQTGFQEEEEEKDEDVEMHSDGVMETLGMDEDDLNKVESLDNFTHSVPPCAAPAWGHTNPFAETWAQPASLLPISSPSPLSDHGAGESETPTEAPAHAYLDNSCPSFASSEPQHHHEKKASAPREAPEPLGATAVPMSACPGTLAAHSNSETSTPEDLQEYDSSSGVESRSDKQQTPIPAAVQPDMEQDLGIHLEKGDGEEEEAETLPADEVLGTGPPTAPASAPSSSSSTSGDEASDTEGEMQINDPEVPVTDVGAGFDDALPTCSLPALNEDEEAVETVAGDGEEDGGGATPQSANSVGSYGFDCTTSNSNAHSMAESCGKSPGIFSLENEEQLPEEAKDPSLIKELTLPSAATAQVEDLLGNSVDLIPLGHTENKFPGLDDQHYLFGEKMASDHLEEMEPPESDQHLGEQESGDVTADQPPYYSTVSDKTDSFLQGDEKSAEVDEDHKLQIHLREDNRNQNHTMFPVANGHYLALVPGNRRPIDLTLAEHFAKIAPRPLTSRDVGEDQLEMMEQHRETVEMQHRQEQERQKRQWLEEERLRLEQQKQLEKQRRELLQLQEEHYHRKQVLQWQLELEHQYRMQQKQIQQQQLRRSPTGVMLSPSSGLCTIYEAMETSDEEDNSNEEQNRNPEDFQKRLRPMPPRDLEWNQKVDMVQQLINQTLILSGDGGCPPLLLLPVGSGGILSPLESSMWPNLSSQFSPPAAMVTSVSSYSPDSQTSSPSGDWTVVEVETQH